MKANFRTIIETEKGFVKADFRNGRSYPESYWYSQTEAQSFTQNQADYLLNLLKGNEVNVVRAIYVK